MPSYRDFMPDPRLSSMPPVLALSPDGSQVAYADDATGQFNVAIQSVSGGSVCRVTFYTDHAVRRIEWHPHGRLLLYVADFKGDDNGQLYTIDLPDGKPRPLTDAPAVQHTPALGAPFSPDGRLLAYVANDRAPGDQDVLIREMATGKLRRIYDGGGRVFAGQWSPDGTRLTIAHWREGSSDHVVYVVRVDGAPAARLTREDTTATYWLGPWLPDGSEFLVVSNADREYRGLAAMHAATGALRWLDTPDHDVDEDAGVCMSADGRVLVWVVNIDGVSQLRGRDLRTGTDLAMPHLPQGQVASMCLTPDGRTVALLISTATKPWNIALVDFASGELRWLTDARPRAVDPATFVEPALIRYPSRDGTQIPAFLYRPEHRPEPTAAVISVHGGPVAQERPTYRIDGLYQYLLSQDLAILAPNPRGSSGYGTSYQTRLYRDWGGVDLDDLAGAAAWLREQSWVDPTRIGLYGGSYGGFVVLSLIARLPEYEWAAAVDFYGISNLVTLTKASPPTWRSKIAAMIGDPDTDADFLLSRSPVTYADQIRAPLFIIQGGNDPRVPRGESDQIVGQLTARGVEVRYDVYPDEGHGFTRSENRLQSNADAADFLITHLTR